jgi:hypothetical protein
MAADSDFEVVAAGRILMWAADALFGAAEGFVLMMLSFVVPTNAGDS